jgi:hypothetical protein
VKRCDDIRRGGLNVGRDGVRSNSKTTFHFANKLKPIATTSPKFLPRAGRYLTDLRAGVVRILNYATQYKSMESYDVAD